MLFQAILGSLNWKIFCCPTMVANIYNKFYDFHSEKSCHFWKVIYIKPWYYYIIDILFKNYAEKMH